MNILLVTFSLPCPRASTGGAVGMYWRLKALRERHDVTLVVYPVVTEAERDALAELRRSGLRVHVIGEWLPAWLVRLKRRLQAGLAVKGGQTAWRGPMRVGPRLPRLLRRLISSRRYDLLQVEDIGIGVAGLQPPPGVPTLLVEHEVRPTAPDDPRSAPYQPELWRQFDRIVVFTERDASAVCAADASLTPRVRVNPFGIEVPPSPMSDASGNDVLFVGDFNHLPNVDAALWLAGEIMPLVRQQTSRARLLVVGNAPPEEVRRMAAADIVVTGRVESIDPFLREAAVVVAPVRTGGGMRLKVLQALAWGKATVTTTLGAEGLHIGQQATPIVIADTADAFAQAVGALLTDPARRLRLGAEAHRFVLAHFSWELHRERLETAYAELLQTPRPAV